MSLNRDKYIKDVIVTDSHLGLSIQDTQVANYNALLSNEEKLQYFTERLTNTYLKQGGSNNHLHEIKMLVNRIKLVFDVNSPNAPQLILDKMQEAFERQKSQTGTFHKYSVDNVNGDQTKHFYTRILAEEIKRFAELNGLDIKSEIEEDIERIQAPFRLIANMPGHKRIAGYQRSLQNMLKRAGCEYISNTNESLANKLQRLESVLNEQNMNTEIKNSFKIDIKLLKNTMEMDLKKERANIKSIRKTFEQQSKVFNKVVHKSRKPNKVLSFFRVRQKPLDKAGMAKILAELQESHKQLTASRDRIKQLEANYKFDGEGVIAKAVNLLANAPKMLEEARKKSADLSDFMNGSSFTLVEADELTNYYKDLKETLIDNNLPKALRNNLEEIKKSIEEETPLYNVHKVTKNKGNDDPFDAESLELPSDYNRP